MPIQPFDRTFQFTDVNPTDPDDGLAGLAGLPRPEVRRSPELEVMRVRLADSLFGVSMATPRIGRFRVLRVLGRGGMGVVYAAHDDELERQVAVKLLHASRAAGPLARARMTREALALARLSHPNVVQIHEVGEHDGSVYVAMECIDGLSLGEWLRALPAGPRPASSTPANFGDADLSPDETRLVTYCYGPGRGWVRDVPSGELVATLEGIDAYGDVEDRFSRAGDRLTVFADDGDALVWDARTGGLLLRVRDLDKSDWHLPRLADDGASLHIHQRGGAVLTLPATRAGTFAAACRALAATDAKAEVQGACEGSPG